jgi:hypothetical protein
MVPYDTKALNRRLEDHEHHSSHNPMAICSTSHFGPEQPMAMNALRSCDVPVGVPLFAL